MRIPTGIRLVVTMAAALLAMTLGVSASQEYSHAVKRLIAERACVGCTFTGEMMSAAKLEGVNLKDSSLGEANLYFADLRKANLTNTFLRNANLRKVQLEEAILTGADLDGADLTHATGANFAGALTTASTTCPDGAPGPCR